MPKTFVYDRFDARGDIDGLHVEGSGEGEWIRADDAINRDAVLTAQIRVLEIQIKDARSLDVAALLRERQALRNALRECVKDKRRRAEPVGPLHASWDEIFDYEAILAGKLDQTGLDWTGPAGPRSRYDKPA